MSETTPLLPPYSSPSFSTTHHPTKPSLHSIDDAIKTNIDSTSTAAQLLHASLASLAWIFDAQQTFINAFADAMPLWHCTSPSCADTIATSSSSSPCNLPPSSWSWSLPPHTSTIFCWSLQCSSPALLALASSSFFLSCFAEGILLSTLADSRLGRKNMLVLSSLFMSVSALVAASPFLLAYAALRFIYGFGRATIGTSALVLSTELVSRKWHDRVSIFG